ncbi:hypothetical protein [Lachnospira multipara]|uniref:hypothetical protein n=1 Tax=Lachnospira multipara TaxID=28051 RepID=UPI0004863EB7|nr:hypothetical protein [Lachnospira multipara]
MAKLTRKTTKLLALLVFVTAIFSLNACNKKTSDIPTNEHVVMMTATCTNIGTFDENEDYWENSSWTVYYDGQVCYTSTYNKSGVLKDEIFDLSKEDLKTLYTLLTEMNEFEDEEITSEYGNSWYITYFDDKGQLLDSFSGDLTNKSTLTDIEDIIESPLQ